MFLILQYVMSYNNYNNNNNNNNNNKNNNNKYNNNYNDKNNDILSLLTPAFNTWRNSKSEKAASINEVIKKQK